MTTKVTNDNFLNLDASKVTNLASSFDDDDMLNGISTLALRQSSNENKEAYSTSSSYVDVFQDSTGITGLTNALRDSSEYVSSITNVFSSKNYRNEISPTYSIINNFNLSFGGSASAHGEITNANGVSPTSGHLTSGFGTGVNGVPVNFGIENGFLIDMGAAANFNSGTIDIGTWRSNGDPLQWTVSYSSDNSTFTPWDFSGCSTSTIGSTGSVSTFTSHTSGGVINLSGHASGGHGSIIRLSSVPTITARYVKVLITAMAGTDNNGFVVQWDYNTVETQTSGISATGSFTSNNVTAPSSISSMGAIITYQDFSGTNALNTDIIMKLSADGGVTYSTATLTAMTDFSTGIKMAKVNDLSVTAGTSLKYKIEFANQSVSKEARIRGVALQY